MDLKTLECLPSSSRVMRNLAEKQRRDKLNSYIGELATLVPIVSTAPRKLDKTSVLRLSASYLRLHQNIDFETNGEAATHQSKLKASQVGNKVLENLEAFLIVISSSGRVMYVSHGVEKALGYSQVDMMGLPIYCFVNPEDHGIVRRQLSRTGCHENASRAKSQPQEKQRCVFECRIASRPLARGEPATYERVQVTGQFRTSTIKRTGELTAPALDGSGSGSNGSRQRRGKSHLSGQSHNKSLLPDLTSSENGSCAENGSTETLLIALMRIIPAQPVATSLTIIDSLRDQYITRHLPDGRIINSDHRISVVAGYFTEEVKGQSAFSFIYSEDLQWSLMGFKLMAGHPNGEGLTTYRLVSRTGKLIYLRSRGFLEFDPITKEMLGFVCINTLLSEEEGEKEICEIRDLFSNMKFDSPPAVAPNLETPTTPTPPALSAEPRQKSNSEETNYVHRISLSGGNIRTESCGSISDTQDIAENSLLPVAAAIARESDSPFFCNQSEGSVFQSSAAESCYSCSSSEDSICSPPPPRLEISSLETVSSSGFYALPAVNGCGPIRHRKTRTKSQFIGGARALGS